MSNINAQGLCLAVYFQSGNMAMQIHRVYNVHTCQTVKGQVSRFPWRWSNRCTSIPAARLQQLVRWPLKRQACAGTQTSHLFNTHGSACKLYYKAENPRGIQLECMNSKCIIWKKTPISNLWEASGTQWCIDWFGLQTPTVFSSAQSCLNLVVIIISLII